MMKCEDFIFADLLDTDDDTEMHMPEIADHLEHCTACRNQLEHLAADNDQWNAAQFWLSTSCESNDHYAESLEARERWTRPLTWTDTMAESLLTDATHPEMLGRIGRYDVERLIGSGGMGVVFKGHDTELNRPVAVKLLAPYLANSGAVRNRFAREARAAAAVVDDHVVPIHNVETDDEHPFLVMKYIAGGSLQQRLDRDGPLEVCEVLRIGMQTAKGLAAAHTQGLIHRDVKPSNILLDEGVDRALLTDFGLARATDDASLTRSGFQPGTPHYMSPEQVRGESISARSDLFGLGCVLYAACTGHPPFRSETSYAVLRRITDDTPRLIRETNPNVPEWLEQIVMKLLAKSAAERFDSAEQIAEMLERCLAHVQDPTTTPLPALVAELETKVRDRGNTSYAEIIEGVRSPPIGRLIAAAFKSVLPTNQPARKSPPHQVQPVRKRSRVLPFIAVATLFIAALFAGVVFYLQTGNGTIRVSLTDESLEATINGKKIQVDDGEKEYEISAGRQQMVIRQKGSDIEFITDEFQIWRNDQIKFEVRLIAGEVVVSKDGKRFDSKHAKWLPPLIGADRTRQTARPSLEPFFNAGEAYVYSLGRVTTVPDTSELAVELIIFGNDVPFVQPGDDVQVRFDGRPPVESASTFAGEVTTIHPDANVTGNFRVLVKPTDSWPDERYLRPGVPVVGKILIQYGQDAKTGGMDSVPSQRAPESPLEATQQKLSDIPVSIRSPIEGRLVSWGEGIQENAYVEEGELIAEVKHSDLEHLNQLANGASILDQHVEHAQSTIGMYKRGLHRMPSAIARLEMERCTQAIAADAYARKSEATINMARAELEAASKESRSLKLILLRAVTKLELWRERFEEGKVSEQDLQKLEQTVRETEAKANDVDAKSQAAKADLDAQLAVQKATQAMNQVKVEEASAKLTTMRAASERSKRELAKSEQKVTRLQKTKDTRSTQVSDFSIRRIFAPASGKIKGLVATDTLLRQGDVICDLRPDQTQSDAGTSNDNQKLDEEVSFEAGSYSTPKELMADFVAAQRSNDAIGVMSCLSDHAIDQAAAILLVEVAELMERFEESEAPVGEANKWKERLRRLEVDNALANAELAISEAVGNGNRNSPVQQEVLQIATGPLKNPRRFIFECRELFNLLPENEGSTGYTILFVSDGAWAINETDQSGMRLKKFDRGWLIDEPCPDPSNQQASKAHVASQRLLEAIIRDAGCVIYYDWMLQPIHDPDGSIPYYKVIKDLKDLDTPSWFRDKIRKGYFQSVVKIGIIQPNRINDDVISAIGKLETVEHIHIAFDPSDENSLTELQVIELMERIKEECGVEVSLDRKVVLE